MDTRNQTNPERAALRKNSSEAAAGVLLIYIFRYGLIFLIFRAAAFIITDNRLLENFTGVFDIISLVSFTLAFAGACVVMIVRIGIPLRVAMPFKPADPSVVIPGAFCCLGVSVIGGLLYLAVSQFTQSVFHLRPIMPDLTAPTDLPSLLLYICSVIIAPSFLEEIMFRGIIMQSLRRFGDGFALVASSALFSMAHGNLVQGPNAFIVGVAIGFFVLRTGSLWTGIIIHLINNSLAVFLEILSVRASEWPPQMTAVLGGVHFLVYIVGSAAAFIYLYVKYPGFFRFSSAISPTPAGRRFFWFFTTALMIILFAVTVAVTGQYFEAV